MDVIIENEELTEEYWQYLFDIAETEIELEEFRDRCIQESYIQE